MECRDLCRPFCSHEGGAASKPPLLYSYNADERHQLLWGLPGETMLGSQPDTCAQFLFTLSVTMWREQWQPVSKKALWSPTEADLQPRHQPFLLLGLHSNCQSDHTSSIPGLASAETCLVSPMGLCVLGHELPCLAVAVAGPQGSFQPIDCLTPWKASPGGSELRRVQESPRERLVKYTQFPLPVRIHYSRKAGPGTHIHRKKYKAPSQLQRPSRQERTALD